MNLLDHFRRQFSYDAWANQEVMNAIRTQSSDGRSLQLVSHIVAAERLWLERLEQKAQSTPVWPEWELAECESENAEMGGLWSSYLDTISDEKGLGQTISYQNSKGEPWQSTVGDILAHVVMHSAYHRGQIASHMRETGKTPAYTDFIHAVRQGWVK